MKNSKDYIFLALWIFTFVGIGALIGFWSKTEVNLWYTTLHRSALTPPNFVFPIAWTIFYTFIAISGWSIWRSLPSSKLLLIKCLYLAQLLLNWSWTPLFFNYNLIGYALICLALTDVIVAVLIYVSYQKNRLVSLLMVPYLLWLLFATYLNFYIWVYN